MRAVAGNPMIGAVKVGDLAGVLVYKFRTAKQPALLAYRVLSDGDIKLLVVGPHENFYRDLKRVSEVGQLRGRNTQLHQ